MKTIEQKLERLPQNLQQEVIDFLDYLMKPFVVTNAQSSVSGYD